MLFMLGLAPVCASAVAQKAGETTFPPEQIMAGAEIYATNCATSSKELPTTLYAIAGMTAAR